MNLTLKVWRQAGPDSDGRLTDYEARDISPDMSFLEMLDVVNERLIEKGEIPVLKIGTRIRIPRSALEAKSTANVPTSPA